MSYRMIDANLLRLIIALAGVAAITALYFFGQPRKPDQGRYRGQPQRKSGPIERREPIIGGEAVDVDDENSDDAHGHPHVGDEFATRTAPGFGAEPRPESHYGQRQGGKIERIVTLNVTANDGGMIGGPELVVAAEKAGLQIPPGHFEAVGIRGTSSPIEILTAKASRDLPHPIKANAKPKVVA